MDSGERVINFVPMTIINPRKEYWPSRILNKRPRVLKSCTLPTELRGGEGLYWNIVGNHLLSPVSTTFLPSNNQVSLFKHYFYVIFLTNKVRNKITNEQTHGRDVMSRNGEDLDQGHLHEKPVP